MVAIKKNGTDVLIDIASVVAVKGVACKFLKIIYLFSVFMSNKKPLDSDMALELFRLARSILMNWFST